MIPPDKPRRSFFRSTAFQLIIASVLAAILLYYSLRGINWSEVWSDLLNADGRFVALWFVVVTIALFLRALRWRVLLRAEGEAPVAVTFWATSAGYFGNSFLPARAGELVRTLMVSSRLGMSKAFVLTTALTERTFDAITLVVIAALVLLTLPIRPGWFSHATTPFAIAGTVGILGIALLPTCEPLFASILRKLPLPHALISKLIGIMEQVLVGIRALHNWKRLGVFLSYTLVIWFCDTLTAVIGMHALRESISLPVAFLMLTGVALASALPSTPGYVGVFQFVAVSVLVPFGFRRSTAISYSLLFQGLQYIQISFWGLIALTRYRGISLKPTVEPALEH